MKLELGNGGEVLSGAARRRRKSLNLRRTSRFYALRILRLRASPHAIAVGVAAGVFAAFLPFIGIHMALSVAIAWLLGGNVIAATASTLLVGNPFTYPLIWASTWQAGEIILHSTVQHPRPIDLGDLFVHFGLKEIWLPILKPMLIGALPMALIFAVVSYILSAQSVRLFRTRRRARSLSR
jgi:uncharacterized protein (DUF2062 family)